MPSKDGVGSHDDDDDENRRNTTDLIFDEMTDLLDADEVVVPTEYLLRVLDVSTKARAFFLIYSTFTQGLPGTGKTGDLLGVLHASVIDQLLKRLVEWGEFLLSSEDGDAHGSHAA